jgi:hypothetical protein
MIVIPLKLVSSEIRVDGSCDIAQSEDVTGMMQKQEGTCNTLMIRISALIGVLACGGDLCMIHLLEGRYPGYKPLFQAMSDLGHEGSPVARTVSIGWVIMGLMFIVFGYGFCRAFLHYSKMARTAGWMLALYGIGEGLGSGLIPGSPGKLFRTPGSVFHTLLGGLGVLAAMLLPFIIVRMFKARQSSALYWYCRFTTVLGVFFFVLFSISNFYRPEGEWIAYMGLWQRLFRLIYYFFFVYLAGRMLTRRPESAGVPPALSGN